ncbi:uncharacterized protein J3D65DRAFT_318578 [Phyllosticta citribraziliensis]|uniref:Uncharacterized protein n=1 Tax=Phyllosticta citribraziliensis TaxID=989973 RepID=A0ABR1LWL8_9PEZI
MSSPERGEEEAARPTIPELRLRPPRWRQQKDDEQTEGPQTQATLEESVMLTYEEQETPAPEEQQRLSPSLEPRKCATAPEICAWASKPTFIQELLDLHGIMKRGNKGAQKAENVRKFACINRAFAAGWYQTPLDAEYQLPLGATGEKRMRPELERGSQGLKRPWDKDVPADKDIYVPKGVTRELRYRPLVGRWYYPSPSRLSQEFKPE